ncbi:MAG: DUF86 domain-containing protein [Hydrogenobaculum sp.]
MARHLEDYIEDIIKECRYLMDRSKNMTFDDFEKNEDLQRAFVRSLEIIGECAKKLPKSVKNKNENIPWSEIAGMRDKLIYDYFWVDLEIVWQTVIEDIPKLIVEIQDIIKS